MNSNMQYSLVVPIYNDGALSEAFCVEFQKVFQQYLAKQHIEDSVEVIFVNDGSPNDSLTYLEQTAAKFPFVKYCKTL